MYVTTEGVDQTTFELGGSIGAKIVQRGSIMHISHDDILDKKYVL